MRRHEGEARAIVRLPRQLPPEYVGRFIRVMTRIYARKILRDLKLAV
jgi:hypothetical protein